MEVLMPLLLPGFIGAGMLYLALVIGDAIINSISDWLPRDGR